MEWHGKDGKNRVVSISRRLGYRSGRPYVTPVLDAAQAELGAFMIPYNLLWSLCYTRLPPSGSIGARDTDIHGAAKGAYYERYKVYLYIRGSKCVGLCLVERINKAYQVLAPVRLTNVTATAQTDGDEERGVERGEQQNCAPDEDGPIKIDETADDAWMGISRTWVISGCRKERTASTLLDCASKTFRKYMITPKELIAFSQPTQSGARLPSDGSSLMSILQCRVVLTYTHPKKLSSVQLIYYNTLFLYIRFLVSYACVLGIF